MDGGTLTVRQLALIAFYSLCSLVMLNQRYTTDLRIICLDPFRLAIVGSSHNTHGKLNHPLLTTNPAGSVGLVAWEAYQMDHPRRLEILSL